MTSVAANADAVPAHLCALAGGSSAGVEPLRALLGNFIEVLGVTDGAAELLEADSATRLLIAYPDPVIVVAQSLAATAGGSNPTVSELSWLSGLLALHRQNRGRITLFNGDAALADPAGLALQLRQRCALEIEPRPPESADRLAEFSLLDIICAEAMIRRDETLATTLAELEASSLPLVPPKAGTASAVLEAWRAGGDPAPKVPVVEKDLAGENELLQLQLQQVQEELESYFLANRNLQRQLEQLQEKSTSTGQEGSRQTEQSSKGFSSWSSHANRLQADLDAVHASLSWRITAPLRALARPFMEKKTD
jgi:hypothetical protein